MLPRNIRNTGRATMRSSSPIRTVSSLRWSTFRGDTGEESRRTAMMNGRGTPRGRSVRGRLDHEANDYCSVDFFGVMPIVGNRHVQINCGWVGAVGAVGVGAGHVDRVDTRLGRVVGAP